MIQHDVLYYRTLDDIDTDVIRFYQEAAEQLIDTRGAVTALSAALAVIGGGMQTHTRSLITSQRVCSLGCLTLP